MNIDKLHFERNVLEKKTSIILDFEADTIYFKM